MSKLILCLLLLFNINICKETEKVRIFTKSVGNEINVKLGEEFAISLSYISSSSNLWHFLNKNEVQETLQYLDYYEKRGYLPHHIVGYHTYAYFHFKALKETNKAVTLKFSYGTSWKGTQHITTFKINVK